MQRLVVATLMALLVAPKGVGAEEISRVNTPRPRVHAPAAAPGEISKAVAHEVARLGASRTGLAAQSQQGGQRSWAARHPTLTGLLIGAGAGAVVGASTCGDHAVFFAGECPAIGAGIGGGLGAGIGALIGLVS